MVNPVIELIYPAASCVCAFAGAAFDIRSRRVPNFLTLPGIFCGLLMHLLFGGWAQLGTAALAGLICFGIFLIFWLAGGMGAGDVKLMAAVGCLAGLPHVANLLVSTAIAGGMMAIVVAIRRGRARETLLNVGALVIHHRLEGLTPHPSLNVSNSQTLRLPYAVPIATGCAMALCLAALQK
ncbi:MAG TPA: A24 family peptidase [Silvibacterium sp.]|nr:A24 family peptidase [Silvibacterium sp.]